MVTEKFFDGMQKSYDWMQKYTKSLDRLRLGTTAAPGASDFEVVKIIEDKVRLLRFVSDNTTPNTIPLLITYALVNRYVIADLQKGKSMIERLLQAGLDVYVIDWGYPDPSNRYDDLDDYINHYIYSSVQYILKTHGIAALDLLGICQGGTLAVCYSALHPSTVRRLVTMVTPIDFQTERDILSHIIRDTNVGEFVNAFGNVPGQLLNANFNLLQPTNLNIKKWLNSVHSLSDDKFSDFFLNMEAWINDSPDQAGQAYKEFIENFYQANGLMYGTVSIGSEQVNTKCIKQPVLNIFGLQDHLVPPDASRALKTVIASTRYEEMEVDTGHIGMYVSSKVKGVPQRIADWLLQE